MSNPQLRIGKKEKRYHKEATAENDSHGLELEAPLSDSYQNVIDGVLNFRNGLSLDQVAM